MKKKCKGILTISLLYLLSDGSVLVYGQGGREREDDGRNEKITGWNR